MSFGLLTVTKAGLVLYADGRYADTARSQAYGSVTVKDISDFEKDLRTIRRIGYEAEHITVARLDRWQSKFKNTKFVHTLGLIEDLRRSKNPQELSSILHACAITKKILRAIPSLLKIGISEIDLSWKIRDAAHRLGAEDMAFETIVGFGDNTARPHHHPTKRRLKKGDIVQIDMGVKVEGYCSDYSRVFFTGPKIAQQSKAYTALLKAKKSAERLVKKGVSNRALDREARRVLRVYGYDKEFCHSLGHGVGLDIHEGVTLSSKAPLQKLRKNEVITIEPGLYFPGEFGMRIEDTIVVS